MTPADKAITIMVRQSTYDRLVVLSREPGQPNVAALAKGFFNVGLNLCHRPERGWPQDEAELDEQVKLVMCLAGQADFAAIARFTGVKKGLVARILDGFTVVKNGGPFPLVRAPAKAAPEPLPAQAAPAETAAVSGGGGTLPSGRQRRRKPCAGCGRRDARSRRSQRRPGPPSRASASSRKGIATCSRLGVR